MQHPITRERETATKVLSPPPSTATPTASAPLSEKWLHDRFTFPRSYTLTTDVLTDVSSKNKHAARELVQAINRSSRKLNSGAKAIRGYSETPPRLFRGYPRPPRDPRAQADERSGQPNSN